MDIKLKKGKGRRTYVCRWESGDREGAEWERVEKQWVECCPGTRGGDMEGCKGAVRLESAKA